MIGSIPIKENVAPTWMNDARLYTLHEKVPWRALPKGKDPFVELNRVGFQYQYLGEFSGSFGLFYPGVPGGPVSYMVVRSKRTGIVMTLPNVFQVELKADARKLAIDLENHFSSAESVVRSGQVDHQLDFLFQSPFVLNKEVGDLEARSIEPKEKFDPREIELIKGNRSVEKVTTYLYDQGRTRRVAFREMFRSGQFWIVKTDSYLERIPSNVPALPVPTEFELGQARQRQREWLTDVVTAPYEKYVRERGWPEAFIRSDFSEVLETADRTLYVQVYLDNGNGQPQKNPYMSFGMTRAPYGVFLKYNSDKRQWDQTTAPFGYSFLKDFPGPGYIEMPHASGNKVNFRDVPLLKMEKYLDVRLHRPFVIDRLSWAGSPEWSQGGAFKHDLPSLFGQGVIWEPCKFYIEGNTEFYDEALAELMEPLLVALLPHDIDMEFSLKSQWVYFFNPLKAGKLLYRKRGAEPDSRYPQRTVDGIKWHVFGLSPYDFLKKWHNFSRTQKKSAAVSIVKSMQMTADRLYANQSLD